MGKTCFLSKLKNEEFSTEYIPTIMENFTKEYTLDGVQKVVK